MSMNGVPAIKGGAMTTAKSERWQGILVEEQPAVRRAVSIVLIALAITIPLGSLGYYSIGDAQVLISIIPVTLAALLFEKWHGCIIGAIAGCAEFIHAR